MRSSGFTIRVLNCGRHRLNKSRKMLRIQFLGQKHLAAAGASPTRSIRRREKTGKHAQSAQHRAVDAGLRNNGLHVRVN